MERTKEDGHDITGAGRASRARDSRADGELLRGNGIVLWVFGAVAGPSERAQAQAPA